MNHELMLKLASALEEAGKYAQELEAENARLVAAQTAHEQKIASKRAAAFKEKFAQATGTLLDDATLHKLASADPHVRELVTRTLASYRDNGLGGPSGHAKVASSADQDPIVAFALQFA